MSDLEQILNENRKPYAIIVGRDIWCQLTRQLPKSYYQLNFPDSRLMGISVDINPAFDGLLVLGK